MTTRPLSSKPGPVYLYIQTVVLAVWGALPLAVMAILLFLPPVYAKFKWVWGMLAVLWALASLTSFCVALHGGFRTRRPLRFLQSIMGLMCTLVLGLPAIIVSSLPLVGSPLDFVEALSPRGNEVVLEDWAAAVPQKPILYIVGVDLSSSFIAGSGDPRLAGVYETLDSIFGSASSEGLSYSIDPKDLALFFGFADQALFLASNERNGQGAEGLRRQAFQNLRAVVPEYLNGRVPPGGEAVVLNRGVTDIVDFLDSRVCAEIRDRGDDYSQIRVVMFSDLIQSVPFVKAGESLESIKQKRAERLDRIEKCLKKSNIVATAFYLSPYSTSNEEFGGEEMNVGSYFKSNLSERWQEVDLDSYGKADLDKRAMICEGLYSRVVTVATPLYLKYQSGPDWENISSRLRLPKSEEADRIFLGLSSVPGAPSPIKIRLFKERVGDFVLGLEEKDVSFKSLNRTSSEQNPLQVAIEGYPDIVRNARAQLLVGVPGQSILYKVPIVALGILPSKSLYVLKIILIILHCFPAALAYMVIRDLGRTRSRPLRKSSLSSVGNP